MTTRTIILTIVAALVAIPCAVSMADPVDDFMDYRGMAKRDRVRITFDPAGLSNDRITAGQMKIRYQDENYLGYCVDIYQYAGDAHVTELAPSDVVPGGVQAAFLFETYGDAVSNGRQAAAIQIAIWEVLYETADSYDIRHGAFKAGGNNQVTNLAQVLLDSVPVSYDPSPTTIFLYSESKQDMMISGGEIPEPGTMALLSIGGAMTVIRRRRRTT